MEEMNYVEVTEVVPATNEVAVQNYEEPEYETGNTAAAVGIIAVILSVIAGAFYAFKRWLFPWLKDKKAENDYVKQCRKEYRESKKSAAAPVEVVAEPESETVPASEQPAE